MLIFIEKMSWFINNKDKIPKMGKKSRNLVEKNFLPKKLIINLSNCYLTIVNYNISKRKEAKLHD